MSNGTAATPNPKSQDPKLEQVIIWVCQPCLDNEPGECHTPGCIQFLRSDIKDQLGERLDFEYHYELVSDHDQARLSQVLEGIGEVTYDKVGAVSVGSRDKFQLRTAITAIYGSQEKS